MKIQAKFKNGYDRIDNTHPKTRTIKQQRRITGVLLQVGLDIVIFGCSSLSAAVSADGILLGF